LMPFRMRMPESRTESRKGLAAGTRCSYYLTVILDHPVVHLPL